MEGKVLVQLINAEKKSIWKVIHKLLSFRVQDYREEKCFASLRAAVMFDFFFLE